MADGVILLNIFLLMPVDFEVLKMEFNRSFIVQGLQFPTFLANEQH